MPFRCLKIESKHLRAIVSEALVRSHSFEAIVCHLFSHKIEVSAFLILNSVRVKIGELAEDREEDLPDFVGHGVKCVQLFLFLF